jgi:steroid delta-isomerase-like uncharacterized protein
MGETRDLVARYIEVWNDHDKTGWGDAFSTDAEMAAPGGLAGIGSEAIGMFYGLWQDAFPDNQVRIMDIFADGSTGVLQAVFEGTHTATLDVPGQPIPATGKRVSIPFINVVRLADDKITAFRLYFDRAELMEQLGLVPAPA